MHFSTALDVCAHVVAISAPTCYVKILGDKQQALLITALLLILSFTNFLACQCGHKAWIAENINDWSARWGSSRSSLSNPPKC